MLTDNDILLRLSNIEDGTVERKTASDYRDCVKAAVAFSNSLPVGEPGIIYVGLYDSGEIESNLNPESLQKKVSGELSNIYPPINPQLLVREKEGKPFLAVIVHGSPNRPHFSGKAYIRSGTQTIEASEPQFRELIDKRSSKTAAILEWKDKQVTLTVHTKHKSIYFPSRYSQFMVVSDCNQFFVTLRRIEQPREMQSFPLERIAVSYDHKNACLEVQVEPV